MNFCDYNYIQSNSYIKADIISDFYGTYIKDKTLEKKYLEYLFVNNKILLRKTSIFMGIFYIYLIILGVHLGWPKIFWLFPLILLFYIFVFVVLLKSASQTITSIIVYLISFLLILTFEILFYNSLENNYSNNYIFNQTKSLIIFKNIFVMILMKPSCILDILYPLLICGSIILFLLLKKCDFVFIINDVFIELCVSSYIYLLKINFETQRRRIFIDYLKLENDFSYFKDIFDLKKDFHFSIKDSKIAYLNTCFAKFLIKNFWKNNNKKSEENLTHGHSTNAQKSSLLLKSNNNLIRVGNISFFINILIKII